MTEQQIEQELIKNLTDLKYVHRQDIRDRATLEANFREKFEALNRVRLTDGEFSRLLEQIITPDVFSAARLLRERNSFERDDGTPLFYTLVNIKDWCKNTFEVVNQLRINTDYSYHRYDVILLINGVPVVQIELKTLAISPRRAMQQIVDYKNDPGNGYSKTLLCFLQLFIVSNMSDTWYFANNNNRHFSFDADERFLPLYQFAGDDNKKITQLDRFADHFLAKCTLAEMISRYMVLVASEQKLMVMRPYQIYAVQAIVDCIHQNCGNGYIWHTTGSGKTLTSFKASTLLKDNPDIEKCLFVVDRKDLDSQTTEEFNKFENGSVDATDRTDVLVKQMQDKNRQLIVTTMQKMANAVKRPQYAKIMDAYKDEKVVFIIDECHRSQFGDMHKDIVRHFQKAQFFGFTGTPRFEVNGKVEGKITQTTEMLFGECVHNYLIKDAIFDNNVLGFHVEYIKTMEGDFDWDDPTLANAIDVNELYLSEERMSLIANHIIQNHKAKTRNRQYTAIFAVSSIEALVKYYDIFKSIKHDLNISGIFSYGQNEDAEGKDEHSRDALERIIKDYNEMYSTNFSTDTFAAYHKDISDRVKGKKTKPLDILLVVNMFLTGFDSKTLSVLYVDKDLKYHDLLQAYSRTNRVEKETKPFGIVICYRNLKKQTDDALTLFSKAQDTSGIIVPDYDYFVEKFNEMVIKLKEIADTPATVDTMQSEEDQKQFVVTFRELTKYLQSLHTFIEFSFDQNALTMSEQEYQDYKSKYLMLYSRQKTDREVVSVLNDVDFCIELMESDRINVAYIMNLIRNIHFDDAKQKDYDIKHIKDELGRTDNPQLLKKVEILQSFLDTVVAGLNSADEIDAAYNDFENAEKQKEIEAFAHQEDIDAKILTDFISEYEFSGTMDAGNIRDRLTKPMPLLKKRSLVNRIVEFIRKHTEKYQ